MDNYLDFTNCVYTPVNIQVSTKSMQDVCRMNVAQLALAPSSVL